MKVKRQTDNPFLNMFEVGTCDKRGQAGKYFFASRAATEDRLKANCGDYADGVDIVAMYGDRLVLVRQFRAPVDGYIYECPAGLVDRGESVQQAAVRELWEETGLTLTPLAAPDGWDRGFYTSVGMSDEACAVVFGRAEGQVSDKHLESDERIEVVLADRDEAARILREERLSMRCALILMQFAAGALSSFLDK